MNTLDLRRYVLSIILVTTALAGCGRNSAIQQAGSPALPPIRSDAGKLRGETFLTSQASNGCVTSRGRVVSLSFQAKGHASGPYPGSFSLTGEATLTPRSPYFSETFTIKSGSKTISGSTSTTNLKLMKVTCVVRLHRSRSFSFTKVPANVENTLGPTTLNWANSTFRQTFR